MDWRRATRGGLGVILESIITTFDDHGIVNIAPMGPQVDESFVAIDLKPFRSSRTFTNLTAVGSPGYGRAVVHVTDDVELIAAAAIGTIDDAGMVQPIGLAASGEVGWFRLNDCCRWFAVEVVGWSDDPANGSLPRPTAQCRVIHRGTMRPMFGLNRGKQAVIEAAILATRIDLLGREEVKRQFVALRPLVEKTGGLSERLAWDRLERFVDG